MKSGYGAVLMAAACGTVCMHSASAQSAKETKKPVAAVRHMPAAAKAEAGGAMSDTVGTLGSKKFTFGEVVAKAQKENPNGFNQTVAQMIGTEGTKTLFGPAAHASYTVTKAKVMSTLRESSPKLLGDTLRTMLEFEAVDREVKKQNIEVTPAQVDKRIDQFLKMLRTRGQIPQGVTDAQFLQQNNVTRDTLRKNFQVQAKLYSLVEKDYIDKRLGHNVSADDFFKARHILIKVPAPLPGQSPADIKKADDAALTKLMQISADIESKKKTFEAAAKESSEDDGTKDMGGELGIQMRTVFVKEFETAAYQMKPMEISKPVKSQFGYHLIQLEQRGKDIPEEERQTYLDNFASGQMQVYLRTLMKRYGAVNKLERPANPMQMQMPGQ